ncbi:unnamed protein product [Hymenolepis diminuta]|uniref:PDZ domain-containing protein n=1 Tax=Hymenolepis diminuta TaxID=6216 RepID=A0A158QG70_HYMDI|nr:unnamed protein product [Hymenolepis diminuta]
MKHKPQITTDLDDFESLLQETSSVVSNGGDTRGSSPRNTPFKEKIPSTQARKWYRLFEHLPFKTAASSTISTSVNVLLDKLLVICPNSEHCNEVLSRCDLESHLVYWCRGTVVPCSNAKTGCQFRAARALQSEHRRECRFQPRTPGTTHVAVSGGSPIVRPIATKSVVRFGPMPAVRRVATEAPLMSAEGSAFEETTPSPPTTASSIGGGGGVRSASHIRDCEVTTIELPWKPNASLGISFVGGSDTPLLCIVIQEVYLDGIVAMDGRLRPGDQILEANGIDLTQATHHQARTALTSVGGGVARSFELTVYRERALVSECGGSSSSGSSGRRRFGSTPENPFEREEILQVTLMKRSDKRLGIKLVGKKNLPGVYILGLVPDSEADLDGRLNKDDRILEINGIDLREGTQEEAANIIRKVCSPKINPSSGEHEST